jgi:prepilin-type N-terminal cleavage/methylation domain-containing protein
MKRAFTLIEILISVIILSIMVFVLSDVVKNMNVSKNILQKNLNEERYKKLALKVLYYDILNSQYLTVSQKNNYSVVRMRTFNSLHNLPDPYVVWYVSKKNNTLMRMEMPQNTAFFTNTNNYYLDKFAQNVKIFKIYRYFYKYFVYIDDGKPIYFEMYKGF